MLRARRSEHLVPPRGVSAALQAVAGASPGFDRARTAPEEVPEEVMMAVVHTRDRVRFMAFASRRDELIERIACYVRESAADVLWAHDAASVRDFLDAGDLDAAITHYFATVGRRWDEEWLVTAAITAHSG